MRRCDTKKLIMKKYKNLWNMGYGYGMDPQPSCVFFVVDRKMIEDKMIMGLKPIKTKKPTR